MPLRQATARAIAQTQDDQGVALRRHACNGRPVAARRRLSASGAPARTAQTPAFGRGAPSSEAQSPAANTCGWLTLRSSLVTRMQPAGRRPRRRRPGTAVPSTPVAHKAVATSI